jgi:hypothetical protein
MVQPMIPAGNDRSVRMTGAAGTIAALIGASIIIFLGERNYPEWRFNAGVMVIGGLLLRIEAAIRSR